MAFYKFPIQPFDPVINYDQPQPTIRYFRDAFSGAGQFSQLADTALPQDQFSALTNVMPPVRGVFYKRWGYAPFISALGYVPEHMDIYADESTSPPTRKIITLSANQVGAYQENGAVFNPSVLVPTGGQAPLMAYSRSTAYFFDDTTPSQKWNGSPVGGVSLTGIDVNNATGTTSDVNITTPATAEASFTDGGGAYPWSVLSGTAVNSLDQADGTRLTTNTVKAGSYGFALPSGAHVNNILAEITYDFTDTTGSDSYSMVYVQLLKAGVPYGPIVASSLLLGSGELQTAYWDLNALGLSITDVDANASSFGVAVYCLLDWNNPGTDLTHWVKLVRIDSGNATLTLNYNATTTANQITVSSVASAGNITLTNGRIYYVVFRNSSTAHMSGLSIPSLSTGAITSKEVNLTGIPKSLDPQVDVKWLLATADGGDETLLYFLAELPNATGSYIDNTDELTLLANNIVQETDANGNDIGVADNTPPPLGTFPVKHQGRLFTAHNATLYCSKNLQELTTSTGLICGRYEEAWPSFNQFDITDDAELVKVLISDGTTLYVGTNRHIRRVTGDSPSDFQLTTIAFNEVGVANHAAISVVYADGSPAGAVWLTPDNRVIQSDFNTYSNIGDPIQDVLNLCLNPSEARVTFYSNGPYDLLSVAINTQSGGGPNDTWCVYDLRAKTWVVWTLADPSLSMLFLITQQGSPVWLFGDNAGNIHQFAASLLTDNGAGIASHISTGFLHLGTPSSRKYLNEIEVITGDPNLLVTIAGANLTSEFNPPGLDYIVFNQPLVVSPLGPYKTFLSHLPAHHRYYKLIFSTVSQTALPILEGFNVEAIPVHII